MFKGENLSFDGTDRLKVAEKVAEKGDEVGLTEEIIVFSLLVIDEDDDLEVGLRYFWKRERRDVCFVGKMEEVEEDNL